MKKWRLNYLLWLACLSIGLCRCTQHSQTHTPPSAKKIDYSTCYFKSLSTTFDLNLKVTKFKKFDGQQDSCLVRLILIDKTAQIQVDSLHFSAILFLNETYEDCNDVLSYLTGQNIHKEIADNMYGDIVVADFNFDGLEDIAMLNDNGGNGGPYYNFYLQGNNQKFKKSQFLTDSVAFFPSKINPSTKTLTTYAHAGACLMEKCVFLLEKNKAWKKQSQRLIDVCK